MRLCGKVEPKTRRRKTSAEKGKEWEKTMRWEENLMRSRRELKVGRSSLTVFQQERRTSDHSAFTVGGISGLQFSFAAWESFMKWKLTDGRKGTRRRSRPCKRFEEDLLLLRARVSRWRDEKEALRKSTRQHCMSMIHHETLGEISAMDERGRTISKSTATESEYPQAPCKAKSQHVASWRPPAEHECEKDQSRRFCMCSVRLGVHSGSERWMGDDE